MQYLGGKARNADKIIGAISRHLGTSLFDVYVEPFVGGGNVICKVKARRKIANDINRYAVAVLKAVGDGWTPPVNISESLYREINLNRSSFPEHLVGFVGFGCSFGGKFFGGYARSGFGRRQQNYASGSSASLVKQSAGLKNIEFYSGSYLELEIPDGSVVYCDPPYEETTEYHHGNFNTKLFWLWATEMSKTCKVFVSEYKAPKPWKPIWVREVKVQINNIKGGRGGLNRRDCVFTLLRGANKGDL